MKEIVLTKNFVAHVDDEDFEKLNCMSWYAGKCGNKIYAKSDTRFELTRIRRYMHRFILNIIDSKIKVDHIDGDTLNNQKNNLRTCSQQENIRHRSGTRKGNTSGYRGVFWNKKSVNMKKPWIATITVNHKSKYLGSFSNAEEAAKAFDDAAIEIYGSFCGKLNFK